MNILDWLIRILTPRIFPRPAKPAPPILLPDPMASEVLPLVNAVRTKHGKPPLARNASLDAIATSWAITMANSGVLSHAGFAERLKGFPASGECVAQGRRTAAEVVTAWENHPPHFAIMVGDYNVAGVGFSRGYWCLDVAKV